MAGVGTRVVRGPHWKWSKQDGGEGRVGTLRSYESHEEVMIIWDVGTAANYRCASHFDLRVLDNSLTGVHHNGYTCEGCHSTPIYGIRWDCVECPTISLCSSCYHGDKHSLRHQFCRLSTPLSRKVSVPVRKKSKKISSRGVFPGARVVRGIDWSWEDQDGGEGHKGKVTKIENWTSTSPRSAVSVVWDHGIENLYRIGHEGMVDVKVVSEAKGSPFYRDHLPLVGEETQIPEGYYVIGDSVCVDSDPDIVRFLQQGHGGWAESMREIIGVVGVITGVDEDGDIVVLYPSGTRWTVNPIALKKVIASPTATSPHRTSLGSLTLSGLLDHYLPGDVVKVSGDMEYVKRQQQGHGDWVESMSVTLDQIGRVIEVTPAGDIKAEVCGAVWTYSPAVLVRVDTEGGPLTPGTSHNVSVMLRHVFETHQASNPSEELFRAAASGDIVKVEELVNQSLCGVDDMFNGQTPLHIACQNGYRDIVRFLLSKGANPDEEDRDGDKAIHFATIGDEPEIIELLAGNYIVDLNARNRRQQTPLHIAVTKGYIIIIETLLKLHCHPSLQDTGGDTPLHDAISKKRDDITLLLLEGGADITVVNSNGFNCLHHASLRGNLGAVRLLLQFLPPTCSVDTPKDDGFTALHLATLNNHIEAAKLIIQHGAYVDSETSNRQTPLHLAVERQNSQIVRLLVEENANVNIPDRYGDSPLHCAIRQHTLTQLKELKAAPQDVSKVLSSSQKKTSSSVAIFLTSHGADFTLCNSSNQTPLDLCSDPSLIKTLKKCQEEYQAKIDGAAIDQVNLDKCVSCHSSDCNMLFLPCGHVTVCSICAPIITNCTLCNEDITDKRQIEECVVCSEQPADILFRPCMHMVACESCASIIKKCVQCRVQIEDTTLLAVCKGGKPTKRKSISKMGVAKTDTDNMTVLQQELKDLREKNLCAVCMDRSRNCVFLCGHGTCQPCADKLTECPICRKPVQKKIILFD